MIHKPLPATGNISSRFSINSEAKASEFIEDLEEIFLQYNMHGGMYSSLSNGC